MKIIGYSIVIISFLSILYQVVLTVLYLKPFILDSILKRKKSWNPYYDPTFTILFSCFCIITIGFTYVLVSDNKITDYSIIIYAILILFVNTFFSLIFFNRKRLIQRKTIEQIQYELDEQKEIEQLEFKQHLDIDNQNPPKKIRLVDVEVITQNLEKIVKTNSEEIVEKLKPKKSIKINSDTINYNSCFSEKQLEYLWITLSDNNIIDENCSKDFFCKNFLVNPLVIDMETISLYHFHKEINKLIDKKISQISFIEFFRDEYNNPFNHGTFRNYSNKPDHKLINVFKNIFDNFPN
ncbi:hypothetical protein ACSV4D_11015 [Flavobacterium sp. ARAG 55.4]|uniref:hypothetical protein n=1 Tax=Flavobacterium sp. ARAG 55.4 TaxID=3451357 RepID=UPI003F4479E4